MTRTIAVLATLAMGLACRPAVAAAESVSTGTGGNQSAAEQAVDLHTAWQAALAVDPILASALATRDAAAESIAVTRARLLPQVSLQSTTQRLQLTTEQSGTTSDFSGRSASTQLVLRQGLYRPRDRIGLEIARKQAGLGELGLVQAQSELWMRTAVAWVDVLAAQSHRALYARTLQTGATWFEQESARYRSGEGTRDAVAEAAAQHAAMKSRLTEAGLDLKGKLKAFNLLTRLDVAAIASYQVPTAPVLMPEPEEELLERILATNPELAAARANEAVSEHRLAQAKADHLPTLDVVGSVNQAQNDTPNTLGTRYRSRQLGLQLVIPIYSGGGTDASQRQAAAALVAAAADRRAAVQRISTQFVSDWTAQAGLIERSSGARELVLAASEQRRAMEMSVSRGLKTWADLGHVEQLLGQRENELVDIIGQTIRKQAQLLSLLPASDPAWNRWAQGLHGAMK